MRLPFMLGIAFALAFASVRPAHAAETITTLVTIDSVYRYGDRLVITGIKQGESTPAEFRLEFQLATADTKTMWVQSCEKLALLAMASPGKYVFSFGDDQSIYTPPSCKLARAVP